MDFDEYQKEASKTAIYPKEYTLYYLTLGFCGEVGELANKVKKIIRDDKQLDLSNLTQSKKEELILELGDSLWYASQIADKLGYKFNSVAEKNLAKLDDRFKRGKIGGSGDNR